MERNTSDDAISSGASTLGTGTDSFSAAGTGSGQDAVTGAYGEQTSGTAGMSGGSTVGSTDGDSDAGPLASAQDRLGQAKDAAAERLGQVKERATALKATLADKLDAGAQSLRDRQTTSGSGGPQLAGATAGSSGGAAGLLDSDQVQRLAGPAADAMEKTADFLRNGDVKQAIEEQVRTNPARTLLIALGVGYVLGKALRR